MKDAHLRLGEAGEEAAVRHLRKAGLRIVGRRVRVGRYEIDIVARLKREWIFVEVKTRTAGRYGTAAEALGGTKRTRLGRAVTEYVCLHGLEREPIRCDFVAVDVDGEGNMTVTHYPGGIHW